MKLPDGTIGSIERDFDSSTCSTYYRVVIFFDDLPDLKLGKCRVVQDG